MSFINISKTFLSSVWSLFSINIPILNMSFATLTISVMIIRLLIDIFRYYFDFNINYETKSSINNRINARKYNNKGVKK